MSIPVLMKNHRPLTLLACLALAACTGSKQKTTWQRVRETNPDKVSATADPAESYTNKLHRMLTEQKVEHKVVTYQYRYQTRLRDEAVGTQTVVIYKDNSDPRNPWWLVNSRTGKPVWLPGEDVNNQVDFYMHRKAQVVAQQSFRGGEAEGGVTMIAKNTMVVPADAPAVTRIAKTKPSPASETAVAGPQAGPAPFIRPARFGPAAPGLAIPFTPPAPAESQFDVEFRRVHGTDYDPSSPIDRRKMETLKHARLDTREPAATRTF